MSEQEARKVRYLRLVHLMGLLTGLFYLAVYNFDYSIHRYNLVLVPLYLLFALWPRLVRRQEGTFFLCAGVLAILSAYASILLYSAGGLEAPGLFWITAIPATATTLFERRGLLWGSLFVGFVLLLFELLAMRGLVPSDVQSAMNPGRERLFSLLTFSAFTLSTIQYYVHGERQLSRHLLDSRLETENLLRVVFHDIASPLSLIEISLRLLQREANSLPCGKGEHCGKVHLEKIRRASSTVATLLDRVRKISALKDGKSLLQPREVEVVATLKNAMQLNQGACEAKQLEVELSHEEESFTVLGDETVLGLVVFGNLLSNAVKFSHPGGKIEVSVRRHGQNCHIRFRDHGIGIPDSLRHSLFELHHATSRKGTAGENGTGYGMPLIKAYLEKMGGRIELECTQEGICRGAPSGSTFLVEIPFLRR